MSGFETASYCARKLSSCDAVEATKKDKAEKKKNSMTEDELKRKLNSASLPYFALLSEKMFQCLMVFPRNLKTRETHGNDCQ